MDDHDHGFRHDLPLLLGRRRALSLLGAAGASALAGAPAMAATCVADARETAGPFPADGSRQGGSLNVLTETGVIRDDIRESFSGLSGRAEGVKLDLALTLVDAGNGCAPLPGHALYIWHCDAVGAYSLYDDKANNYLRGVGVADEAGIVRFTSIFPGCYPSRWPHIHFEVFASPDEMVTGRDSLLIGQLAFTEADSAAVYAAAETVYTNGTKNLGRLSLERDGVFRNDSAAQTAQRTVAMTAADGALRGEALIGVA